MSLLVLLVKKALELGWFLPPRPEWLESKFRSPQGCATICAIYGRAILSVHAWEAYAMLRPLAAMLFDSFQEFTPQDFLFKIARTDEDLSGYWALRKAIFCEEQKVFQGSDRDEIDERAIPIVCNTLIAGMEDAVVGAVRIDERAPGVWYGSRLGVAADFRSIKRISPGVALRNHQPVYLGLGALGAGLIFKAVSTAHAMGCREFLATVQHQNARFFQRLHWEPLAELELFGIPHVKMRADLEHYRPAVSIF